MAIAYSTMKFGGNPIGDKIRTTKIQNIKKTLNTIKDRFFNTLRGRPRNRVLVRHEGWNGDCRIGQSIVWDHPRARG